MNHKRTRSRTRPKHHKPKWTCSSHIGEAPSWWNILFMTRPARRNNKKACHDIKAGKDPDGMTFELGNRKPHEYYW